MGSGLEASGALRARSFLIAARMRFHQRTRISLYTIESRIYASTRYERCVVETIQSEAILLVLPLLAVPSTQPVAVSEEFADQRTEAGAGALADSAARARAISWKTSTLAGSSGL